MVVDFGASGRGTVADFAQLRGYWQALRDGLCLPRRADVDPRGLAASLHRVMIAEQIAPGLARLRLAGSAFTDLMGMEVRGMPLSALFDPVARTTLETVLADVFSGHTAATLMLKSDRGQGRPALTAQLLLLPLLDDAGTADLMIGCLSLRGATGRTPRRFHIADVKRETLHTALHTQPDVAKSPTSFRPAVYRPTTVPYLRLVKG